MELYLMNILWALDRLLNTLLGGSSKEFVSTRIYNHRLENIFAWWCYEALNAIDTNHCELAAHRDTTND